MPTRVAVVVPGIMGSTLFYGEDPDRREEIWGENFWTNYRRLLSNPTLLRWNGRPAGSSLLENVYISDVVRFPKYRLWRRLLRHLRDHPEFGAHDRTLLYGYDWRQSLLETAECLSERLGEHAERMGPSGEGLCYVFFTHSMGGLVVRIALALGVLDPGRVDRIVHIGTPLQGAPVAFRSAYESGSLPFLKELSHLFRWKNAPRFFEHLLDNVRTFDSIYQLMPPADQAYLFYNPTCRSNPLAEGLVPPTNRALADQAHELLREAETMIASRGIETFTIYGEYNQNATTDIEYSVQQLAEPNPGYKILQSRGVKDGDGTVPKWSAAGNGGSCKQNPLLDVDHATMCNNPKVVGLLSGILAR